MRQTSLDAYRHIRNLGIKQLQVYAVIRNNENYCNSDIARHLEWQINTVTPRVNELVKAGLVKSAGTKHYKMTGKRVTIWTTTKK